MSGRHHYAFLPVRWLLRDRFATMRPHRARSTHRCCVIAGDDDRIVPIAQTRRVFEAADEPKSLLIMPAPITTTSPVHRPEMIDGVLRFLRNLR